MDSKPHMSDLSFNAYSFFFFSVGAFPKIKISLIWINSWFGMTSGCEKWRLRSLLWFISGSLSLNLWAWLFVVLSALENKRMNEKTLDREQPQKSTSTSPRHAKSDLVPANFHLSTTAKSSEIQPGWWFRWFRINEIIRINHDHWNTDLKIKSPKSTK